MNAHNVIDPQNGIAPPDKKEHSAQTCYSMGKSQKHRAKWKKPGTEEHALYDSIWIECRIGKSVETESSRLVVS